MTTGIKTLHWQIAEQLHWQKFAKLFFISFCVVWFICQSIYSLSFWMESNRSIAVQEQSIKERVALDSHLLAGQLPLSAQSEYIIKLNQQLSKRLDTLTITGIANISSTALPDSQGLVLTNADRKIIIYTDKNPIQLSATFSLLPAFLATFYALFYGLYVSFNSAPVENDTSDEADPIKLQIDLKSKVLINHKTGKSVALANKPLCFYAALLDYCISHPDSHLNPNKDLPEELTVLCKKYFSRLIELGHTIRKKPDFSNNLEKTLSEIRAALDELYGNDVESRQPLYPKKAVGEGSRSKAHSYALSQVESQMYGILGS